MSRENYGMMNQEIQDDEVTIDLMELFFAHKALNNYSVCGIHGTGSVRRNEDVRDTEVHVSNEELRYDEE